MYGFCVVVAGIFCAIGFIAFTCWMLTGFWSEAKILAIAVLVSLIVAPTCGAIAYNVNEQYNTPIPQEANLVIGNIYEMDGKYIRQVIDPNQTSAEWWTRGDHTIIEEVTVKEVLDIMMEIQAPSAKQWLFMEELAAECGVDLPPYAPLS